MSRIQVSINESEFLSLSEAITADNVDQLRYYPRPGAKAISDTHRDQANQLLAGRGIYLVGHGWHISLATHHDPDAPNGTKMATTYWLCISDP
ncbi:MAG: hypothetical protein ACREA9_19935 [Pyrinomonadaceae bacterium]